MTWRPLSIVPVWVGVLALAVAVGLWVPAEEYLIGVTLAFAAAIFASFCGQLLLQQKEGLVGRMTLSIVGSLVILVVASAVLWGLAG